VFPALTSRKDLPHSLPCILIDVCKIFCVDWYDNNNKDLFYVIALFPHQLQGKVCLPHLNGNRVVVHGLSAIFVCSVRAV
jgi:hypothetical protein